MTTETPDQIKSQFFSVRDNLGEDDIRTVIEAGCSTQTIFQKYGEPLGDHFLVRFCTMEPADIDQVKTNNLTVITRGNLEIKKRYCAILHSMLVAYVTTVGDKNADYNEETNHFLQVEMHFRKDPRIQFRRIDQFMPTP